MIETDFLEIDVFSCDARHKALFDKGFESLVNAYPWRAIKHGNAFYLKVCREGESLLAHRLVMGCTKGDGKTVDHINGNTLDNRKSNLRFVTREQNCCNRKAISESGFRGVHKARDKFVVKLRLKGVVHYGGIFSDPEQAAKSADEIMKEIYGPYARLNFR